MTASEPSLTARTGATVRSLGHALPVDVRDRRWLFVGFLPACVAVAIYLATNPFPASGGGLYTTIAREIAANGYRSPSQIPGYTASGVPFAYPPLQFYLLAILLDVGLDPLMVMRIAPGLAVVASTLPVYLLARDLADSRPVGSIAAASVALNPQILQWHVTAGGFVRAFAFLYALTAVYAGYHVFGRGGRRAVAVGLLAFGMTLLTHPTYSLFVVASYLLFWAVRDRSVSGFRRGLVVGFGGLVLASPWLVWVALTHGLGVFGAAAGTHGGIGGGIDALAGDVSPFMLVPVLGAAYLLYRRQYLLPAWLVAAEVVFAQPRFAYTVGSVVVPVAGVGLLRDRGWLARFDGTVAEWSIHGPDGPDGPDGARTAAAVVLVVAGTVGGGAYLAHEMTLVTDPSTPEYLDEDAVAAMEWTAAETDPDATFVVLGDTAEWFPALTDRTILVGPWGVEWVDAETFDRQVDAFERVSACHSAACVEGVAAETGQRPAYVYVPKGQYTIRGENAVQFGTLERSFEAASHWESAYENDGVVVYRRTVDF